MRDTQAIDDQDAVIRTRPDVAAIPVTRVGMDPDGESLDGGQLGWSDDDEPTRPHIDQGNGLMDAIRRFLGRGQVQ